MSEDTEGSGPENAGTVATGFALGAADRTQANAFLREQTRLSRLQAESLEREDRLRQWSLKIHHISALLKLAFEFALALIFLAAAATIGGALWMAAHDDSLVIDAFKVPPDLAAKGLAGDVLAGQFLDQLTRMQTMTDSSRAPSSYAADWDNDIKVDIPDTGISVADAYRYLAGWLGHQTHVSGAVYHTTNGLALTVRVTNQTAVRVEGDNSDKLVAKAAEEVFHQTQPYRYAVYVSQAYPGQDGGQRQDVVLRALALNGPLSEKPWAYTIWAYDALNAGNVAEALYRARKAVELAPGLPLTVSNLAQFEEIAGHDERALAASRATLTAVDGPGRTQVMTRSADAFRSMNIANIAEDTGDYQRALDAYQAILHAEDFEGIQWAATQMMAADLILLHDPAAANIHGLLSDAAMMRGVDQGYGWSLTNIAWPGYLRAVAMRDWHAALADQKAVQSVDPSVALGPIGSLFALATAMTGNIGGAWHEIGRTPLDCYSCLRVRAQIDAVSGKRGGAAYWFARAVASAPSLPFAEEEWGRALLTQGDATGAAAKFESAHGKAPKFADPLEGWGEALMAANKSHMAVAKFQEANRYAPKWGRLHLKWGEALVYVGKSDEAKTQFIKAATLYLTSSEKVELARHP